MDVSARRLFSRWQQGILTAHDQLVIVFLLVVQSVIRGFDFTVGVELFGAEYRLLRNAADDELWGIAFLTVALLLGLGITLQRHVIVFLGHAFGALLWSLFALGLMVGVLATPGEQGLRAPTSALVIGMVHMMFATRTGPTPLLLSREAEAVETIAGPSEGDSGE